MSELRLSRRFAAVPELSMTDTSSGETPTVAGEYTVVERPRRVFPDG